MSILLIPKPDKLIPNTFLSLYLVATLAGRFACCVFVVVGILLSTKIEVALEASSD